MIKLQGLQDTEIEKISNMVTDSFFDYEYSENDMGLKKFITTRENMFIYIDAIVRAAYKSGLLYGTSKNLEGVMFLAGEGFGSIGFIDGMKMIFAEKKALGGWRKMKEFISESFSDGGSIETRMNKAKRKFIRIEVLVVAKEYQKKGYMRQMMEYVYRIADEKKLPVILDTDDKNKYLRYEHLGMTLDRIRNCGNQYHTYDMIREVR